MQFYTLERQQEQQQQQTLNKCDKLKKIQN